MGQPDSGTLGARFSARSGSRLLTCLGAFLVTVAGWGVVAGTASAATTQYSNPNPIAIPDNGTVTSHIDVSGAGGCLTKVTAKLRGFHHELPEDLTITLYSPAELGARYADLMNLPRGSADNPIDLTFDDDAPSSLPDAAWTSGTYKPETPLSALNGAAPDGDWVLYIQDHFSQDTGAIDGGWSLALTTEPGCAAEEPPPPPGEEAPGAPPDAPQVESFDGRCTPGPKGTDEERGKANRKCEWKVDIHIEQAGIQTTPPVTSDSDLIATTTLGGGSVYFSDKPTDGPISDGTVYDLKIGQADEYIHPDFTYEYGGQHFTPIDRDARFRSSGKKRLLRLEPLAVPTLGSPFPPGCVTYSEGVLQLRDGGAYDRMAFSEFGTTTAGATCILNRTFETGSAENQALDVALTIRKLKGVSPASG